MATRRHGGKESRSIRCRSRIGYGGTRGSMAQARLSMATLNPTLRAQQMGQLPADPQYHDLVPTDRSQSAQRAQKHRSKYRRRQTSVAAKRGPARAMRRNRGRNRRGRRRLPRVRGSRRCRLQRPDRRRAGASAPAGIAVMAIATATTIETRSCGSADRLAGRTGRQTRHFLEARPILFWPRTAMLTAVTTEIPAARPALDASANQSCATADPQLPTARQPRQRNIRAPRTI
jgi:hypothetical protein